MEQDLLDFIPNDFFSVYSMNALVEQSLLYLGRESLQNLCAAWNRSDAYYTRVGTSSGSVEKRMVLISVAQECRKKSEYLANLATRAKSKPQLFGINTFLMNERVTCFLPDPPEIARKLIPNCHFFKAVITKIVNGPVAPTYRLNLRDKFGEITRNQINFTPDRVSLFPTEDFQYLKCHPNFFRLYLGLRAKTNSEVQKIDQILSAL